MGAGGPDANVPDDRVADFLLWVCSRRSFLPAAGPLDSGRSPGTAKTSTCGVPGNAGPMGGARVSESWGNRSVGAREGAHMSTRARRGWWTTAAGAAASLVVAAGAGSMVAVAGPAGAATTFAVQGGAFGVSLDLGTTALIAPTPSVTLPSTGKAQTSSAVSLPPNTFLTSLTATAKTAATNAGAANEQVTSSAKVENLDLALAGQGVTATTVTSSCT